MKRSFFMTLLLINLTFLACSTSPPETPPQVPTPTLIHPPPTQGPAVLGEDVEIEDWEYFGPWSIGSLPPFSETVRQVGKGVNDVRLVWKEDGFDLAYSQFPCADEPVVVVHADATIEFWPVDRIELTCEAAEAFHMLAIKWETDIPFEDWEFIYYPPEWPIP